MIWLEKALFWGLTFKNRGRLGSRSAYSIIYQYLMIHPPSIPWQKGNCPYKPSESIVLKGAFYHQLMTFSSNVLVEKEMRQWASFGIMIFSFHQFVYGKICWGLRKVCSSGWWRLMKVPYNINNDDGFLTVRVFRDATTDMVWYNHIQKKNIKHSYNCLKRFISYSQAVHLLSCLAMRNTGLKTATNKK